MEGYTIKEMAKKLKITEDAVYLRIIRKGIKPLTKQAVYPFNTLENIREPSKGGRPKNKKS
jgi:predicted ArsR family transcriptional regulator